MLKRLKKILFAKYYLVLFLIMQLYCTLALADLPPAPDDSNFDQGQFLQGMWDFLSQLFKYSALVLAAGGVLGFGYALISSFLHAKQHKNWGEFGSVALVGGVVLIIVLILANYLNTHFGSTT